MPLNAQVFTEPHNPPMKSLPRKSTGGASSDQMSHPRLRVLTFSRNVCGITSRLWVCSTNHIFSNSFSCIALNMNFQDYRTYLYLSLSIVCSLFVISTAQRQNSLDFEDKFAEDKRIKITWCTISYAEQRKCNTLKMANERDRIRSGYDAFRIECLQATDKDECMLYLDQERATITSLDAGEVFIGGRYHSLVPIAQEIFADGLDYYYSVAVVKKGKIPEATSLYDLRGKRACFAGVETYAGWVVPIYTLMQQGGMEIIDCNNHVKSATRFFGPSCAVNSLSDKYNPIGDNSDKLCQICIGKIPGGRCTSHDPYAGYEGAFRCLLEVGDIAFIKHSTIPELLAGDKYIGLTKESFELYCKDGSRRPLEDYQNCNWGRVPSDAIVTTSASSVEKRQKLQDFLSKAAKFYKSFNRTTPYNFNDNDRPLIDENGNRYDPGRPEDDYNRDQYDPNRNQYDQNRNDDYRNRPDGGRFKRQQPYNTNNYNERNNQNDFDQSRQNYDRNNQNYDDKFRPPENNPFERDPFTINREKFGVNIDPYRDSTATIFNRTYFEPNIDLNNTYYEVFSLFESSPRYGIDASNLLIQDYAKELAPLPESSQTYAAFLGRAMDIIMGVRDCQVNKMTLCVTSDMEKDKCIKMRTALKAQLLKPEIECYKGHSQINCMQAIRSGIADIAVLDASDVYTAGLNFELVPFISEVYNLNEPEYYVVAVGKETDPSTELTYLRGKYTCHGGINTAAGWVYPLAFLISNGWIRPYGCNSIRAAAEYFTKSCVPGALSTEYNTGVPYDNMCDLCHGTSYRYCRRDASEDYYGHTGAFRCLVEGGGHVAFVKHTTVTENTGGKRAEWWARDNLNDDFELLCPDGTRAEINEYTKCNLGRVKANAIVTRGGYAYNETHVNAFINLFLYAQTFYGRKTTDEFSFSMFSSAPPYTDLIFQDATTQLKVIHPTERHYALYLGPDFMRARRIVDCHAGSAMVSASTILLVITTIMCLARNFY